MDSYHIVNMCYYIFLQMLYSSSMSNNIINDSQKKKDREFSLVFRSSTAAPLKTQIQLYRPFFFMHFLGPTLQFLGLCFHISRRGPSVRNCSRNSSSLYPCGDRQLLAKSHSRRQRVRGNELYHGGNTISFAVMDKKVSSLLEWPISRKN